MQEKSKSGFLSIIKFSGAFAAFFIGSGYQSGQEIIQFFSSYGFLGIAGGLISLVLFAWSALAIIGHGFNNKATTDHVTKHPFDHWFIFDEEKGGVLAKIGKGLSVAFEYFIPVFLFCVVVIMVSGAGATINQLFGLPVIVGCVMMAIPVFLSTAFGLKRLITVIGVIGPITTVFTIFVAIYAIVVSPIGFTEAAAAMQNVNMAQASNFWWLSGILYVAFNVTGSVPFLTSLGTEASSKKQVHITSIFGSIILMGCAILLVIPHVLYAEQIAGLPIPNLYLAELISPICSLIFALCLIIEIFATAAPMLWTTCNKFTAEGSKQNKILAFVLSVVALLGGQLPFGTLVGIVYPYMGYIGIFFLVCVLVKQLVGKKPAKA